MEQIKARLLKALDLTLDFYSFIPESSLTLKIENLPSNTIGEQVWCIIGARESYLKALKKGSWDGFSCSLKNCTNKGLVVSKLEETFLNIKDYLLKTNSKDINMDILIDLLEHEVQHHGQLIRYSYANKLGFPQSWNDRYTV